MTFHDTAPHTDLNCRPPPPADPRMTDRMTTEEYREALDHFGLGINHASRFLGVSDKTSRKYAEEGPPPAVSKLLKFMMAKDYMPEDVDAAIRRWEREA